VVREYERAFYGSQYGAMAPQPVAGWGDQDVLAASRHCCRDAANGDIPLLFGRLGLGIQKPPRPVSQ
jgi:hypothetical protein